MSGFVERAIARAGLGPVLRARRAGEIESLRRAMDEWQRADLLVLGALADVVRSEEVGEVVVVHSGQARAVSWVEANGTDLELLRAVAVARIASPPRARIGVDWERHGLELAQVALGFGASELCGPITTKSRLPILDGESRKVKGQGAVAASAIKKLEIAALLKHARRVARFAEEDRGREALAHA
jgi:hypothetical protein